MPESLSRVPDLPPTSPRPLLRRSRQDRVLFGVCGGIGRYLDLDPVIVRVVAVALVFAGVGAVAYLVAWLVIPEADGDEPLVPADAPTRRRTMVVLGTVLLVAGLLLAVRGMPMFRGMSMFHAGLLWPGLVVLAGAGLLVVGSRR